MNTCFRAFYTAVGQAPIVQGAVAIETAWSAGTCDIGSVTLSTFSRAFDYGTTACEVWNNYIATPLSAVLLAVWACIGMQLCSVCVGSSISTQRACTFEASWKRSRRTSESPPSGHEDANTTQSSSRTQIRTHPDLHNALIYKGFVSKKHSFVTSESDTKLQLFAGRTGKCSLS
jgi:hypothetical protein